jgi:Berberine and berberine like
MQPLVEPAVYVNNLGEEGDDRVREADRLAGLKRQYDPTNFFRSTENVPPASTGSSTAPR